MGFSLCRCFLLYFCVFSTLAFAQDEIQDTSTGESFPRTVSFSHAGKDYNLQATGVATRKKFFFKIYSIAHYLQTGKDAADNQKDKISLIMQDDNAKQFTIKWVRDVETGQIQNGYKESFKNTLGDAEYSQLQGEIDKFIQFFNQNAKKGDEHILRWLPGGYIEVLINGTQAGSFTNKAFAIALWNLWFGSKSVVNRNDLISLMK